jgi:ubiquinone biosynthesis protein
LLHAFRLARAGWILARSGAFGFLDAGAMPPGPARAVRAARMIEPRDLSDGERGRRLSDALNRLGPAYVKFGQFLATRADIVGTEAADALSLLKDDMAPFPTDEARAIVEANLGRPVDQVFSAFSDSVAAASIAQVHKAELRREESDGENGGAGEKRTVAVKVLRPDVRARFARDLATFYAAARFVERWLPQTRRLKPVTVVKTLERSVILEMDLRLEAAALSEMAENTRDEADFAVPDVEWSLMGRDVLVTEWIVAAPLSRLEAVDAAGHDRKRLARIVVQSFLRHALRDGFFHADMHEGNLFVDDQGRLVAVDLGIMGRIGPKERRFLAEILYGFINRDYKRIAEVHFEAGYVPAVHSVEDFAQALRAIGEPIHGQSSSDISMARLLGLLFEITDVFDMETREELLFLQKTMVVVEGVARRLDPDFDMWTTSEPVVGDWIERHLGPGGRIEQAGEGLAALGRLAGQLPAMAERAEHISRELDRMAEHGLRLDAETVQAIAAAEARQGRSERRAFWVIAISVAIIAAIFVSVL